LQGAEVPGFYVLLQMGFNADVLWSAMYYYSAEKESTETLAYEVGNSVLLLLC
jgi:hypothetical protein